jgi:hypothetical protein
MLITWMLHGKWNILSDFWWYTTICVGFCHGFPCGIGPDAIHSVPTFRQNGNHRFVVIWKSCGDVPTIHEYPLNIKYPHYWNVGTLCIASASTPNSSAGLPSEVPLVPPEIPLVTTKIPLGAVKILLVTTRHRDQWNKNPVGRDDSPSRARVYNMV